MPTPSDDTLSVAPFTDSNAQRPIHLSCPPEAERVLLRRSQDHCAGEDEITDAVAAAMGGVPTELTAQSSDTGPMENNISQQISAKTMASETESSTVDSMTPESSAMESRETESQLSHASLSSPPVTTSTSTSSSRHGYEFSNVRLIPNHTSSFLRAGSRFKGTQQSDRQVYDVYVEIKHVDMDQSYLCGYLRIQGLTEDHPTLTTFFEGEIIGTKHTFQTKHPSWGATDKTDMQHWARFSAWRPLAKKAAKPDFTYKNFAQRENIFMRWKEYFLVPDHRVTTIQGASFEGFYYICFNQVQGTVSGIYFHAKSEKFQQLELKHVDDRGCFGAMEFR